MAEAAHWSVLAFGGFTEDRLQIAPKGPRQISPGQGNASCASVEAALGQEVSGAAALKGRHIATTFVLPIQGDRTQ